MNKIMVPVDFSKQAAYALEVAARIAKTQNAVITVIHMLGLSEAVLTKDESQEFEEARYYMNLAKKRFNDFLDTPYLKGIRVIKIVQNYKIFEELNQVVREQGIDMIVMGSHGTTGFNEFFVGSNTERVVRTSDVPVLVIKEPCPDFKMKRILFASDLSDVSVLAFKKARDFALDHSAHLTLIYVNTPYDNFLSTSEIDERLGKFLSRVGETDQELLVYNDFSVEQGLYEYCKTEDFDVLALATHGRKGLSHFFMGSIGEDLANRATMPVLTFKM